MSTVRPLLLVLGLMLLLAIDGLAAGRTIRVRVLEQNRPRAITIRAEGGTVRIISNRGKSLELPHGYSAQITGSGGEVYGEAGADRIAGDVLHVQIPGDVTIEVKVDRGTPLKGIRKYSGLLAVDTRGESSGILRLINHISVEDYVAAVLPREYGLDDAEGTRAMAVVIRTFALRAAGKYGDYDQTDHTGTQVFDGVQRATAASRAAARTTQDEVLTYGGSLVQAFYFSSSGGHTANNESVWGGAAIPYLRSRVDPNDESPNRSWHSVISKDRMLRALSKEYGSAVRGFTPESRGSDGRYQSVRILFSDGRTRTVTSNTFRLATIKHLGGEALKSTNFTVRQDGAQYIFDGKGFGHGVGMSQWGAHGMARKGVSYREILRYYYPGVSIERGGSTRILPGNK